MTVTYTTYTPKTDSNTSSSEDRLITNGMCLCDYNIEYHIEYYSAARLRRERYLEINRRIQKIVNGW